MRNASMGGIMILGDDDIKAIADEVLRRLAPILNSMHVSSQGKPDPFTIRRETELLLHRIAEEQAEDDRLERGIREHSQKMPADLRPVPEQYKSRSRKKHVLELVKDPTRWTEIPLLSKQWPSIKRKKPADNTGKH